MCLFMNNMSYDEILWEYIWSLADTRVNGSFLMIAPKKIKFGVKLMQF